MQSILLNGLNKPVSRFVLGTPSLNNLNEAERFDLLDHAYALGINTFDTAAAYADGKLEQVLGRWIADRGLADQVVILTKCAHPDAVRNRVTTPDIIADCNESCARLGVPSIDLFLLHRDDTAIPVSVIMDALNGLYQKGKIKVFGGSNWTHERIAQANEYAAKHGLEPMRAASPCMSLVRQVKSPWAGDCISIRGDQDAIAYYQNENMPLFIYSPMGHGMLSGKVKSDCVDASLLDNAAQTAYLYPENIERLRRAEQLAEQYHVSVSQIALSWVYHQSFNPCVIIGASKLAHIKANLDAANLILTPEEQAWLAE